VERVRQQPWLNSGFVNITVNDGTVDVWGSVNSKKQYTALLVLVREVASSVVAVRLAKGCRRDQATRSENCRAKSLSAPCRHKYWKRSRTAATALAWA
jgi:hypothetical protein